MVSPAHFEVSIIVLSNKVLGNPDDRIYGFNYWHYEETASQQTHCSSVLTIFHILVYKMWLEIQILNHPRSKKPTWALVEKSNSLTEAWPHHHYFSKREKEKEGEKRLKERDRGRRRVWMSTGFLSFPFSGGTCLLSKSNGLVLEMAIPGAHAGC